jgi:hypothetical protein
MVNIGDSSNHNGILWNINGYIINGSLMDIPASIKCGCKWASKCVEENIEPNEEFPASHVRLQVIGLN